MINISHIVPTSYLAVIPVLGNQVHMALAHQVLQDVQYKSHFQKLSERGEFVILDNSAFELGEAINDNLIIKAASMVHPSEVILPDILLDASKTISRVNKFITEYGNAFEDKILFMAVPHGKDVQEYIECYKLLSEISDIDTIGIGAIYSNLFRDPNKQVSGRQLIVDELIKANVLSDKAHHLLGLGDDGNLELESMKRYSVIRSCDSSAAYVQAMNDITLREGIPYKKIKQMIDFNDLYSDIVSRNFSINMGILNRAAK